MSNVSQMGLAWDDVYLQDKLGDLRVLHGSNDAEGTEAMQIRQG